VLARLETIEPVVDVARWFGPIVARAWADLAQRAFDIDVLACPRCGGRLRLIATV
jgi:hypothetical protein